MNAVVHEPFGAYPTSSPGHYDYDYEALLDYQQAARDPESFRAYLQKYVFEVDSFKEYIDRALTPTRMQRLECDPRLGYSCEIAEAVTCGGFTGELPDTCTRNEMMIVNAARQIHDGEVAIVGTGLPMAATSLAMYTHAPNLNYIVETGIGDLKPVHASLSVADTRLLGAAKPAFVRNIVESLGFLVQRGLADLGFLGGAQIDMYGNLNATSVGDYARPTKRFPGSGGANPIASCAKRILIIIRHEKRRFLERVEYITSPGFLEGGDSRWKSGLRGGGPDRVITDLGHHGLRTGVQENARDIAAPGGHAGADPGGNGLPAALCRRGGGITGSDPRGAEHAEDKNRPGLPRRRVVAVLRLRGGEFTEQD